MALFEAEIRTDETAQANVRKWIEALRSDSDDYRQGHAWLRVHDGFYKHIDNNYCCLGVACDLLNPNGWYLKDAEEDSYTGERWYWVDEAGQEDAKVLPVGAQAAYRLTDPSGKLSDPVMRGSSDFWTLDAMNDAEFTFAEIADAIEREFNEALA